MLLDRRLTLIFIAILGLFLSIAGAGGKSTLSLSTLFNVKNSWMIKVNNEVISQSDYISMKKKFVGTLADRVVIDLMIDNRLLIQRAVELGIVVNDRSIRKEVIQRTVDLHVQASFKNEPSKEELFIYFKEHKNWFAPQGSNKKFDDVKSIVIGEYRTYQRRQTLKDLLLNLRSDSDIILSTQVSKNINVQ
jgi:hypothetical protein